MKAEVCTHLSRRKDGFGKWQDLGPPMDGGFRASVISQFNIPPYWIHSEVPPPPRPPCFHKWRQVCKVRAPVCFTQNHLQTLEFHHHYWMQLLQRPEGFPRTLSGPSRLTTSGEGRSPPASVCSSITHGTEMARGPYFPFVGIAL